MNFSREEPNRVFHLAAAPKTRRGGSKKGRPSHGQFDQKIVAADGPSQPAALYRGCQPGCNCLRCAREKALARQQYLECEQFRRMAR